MSNQKERNQQQSEKVKVVVASGDASSTAAKIPSVPHNSLKGCTSLFVTLPYYCKVKVYKVVITVDQHSSSITISSLCHGRGTSHLPFSRLISNIRQI